VIKKTKINPLPNHFFNFKTSRFSTNQEAPKPEPLRHSASSQSISSEDYVKIESFYKSFGTQLHVTNNFASLYTMTLNDTTTDSKATLESIINLFMLNDDSVLLKQNWTVCHRGVPLWLFNTGVNPRRPYRQLKFTLAEKGTGFILWQDRIDLRSDFKIFRKRKVDANNTQQSSLYSLYQENLLDSSSQTTASNLIITFKASDRKTLVFVKFDIYQEVLKFFSYYLRVHNRLCDEIRQRTKSLPVGVGNEIMGKNLAKKTLKNGTVDKQNVSNICIIKYKRISKNDISLPSNTKHLINIKLNERYLYYTLSKLLPAEKQQQCHCVEQKKHSVSQSPSSSLSTSSSINENLENRFTISIDCKNEKKFSFVSPASTTSSSSGKLKTIK
jgi:hypothetical protein